MPPHQQPPPAEEEEEEESITSHLVSQVIVQLQFTVSEKSKGSTSKAGAKSKPTKKKTETKNKEFPFTFEATQKNYFQFLSTLITKHCYEKYLPVTARNRFNIKAIVPPSKARKDAIDIDNFAEYEVMAKKIIDEAPTKLSVFFSLDDVKAAAAREGSDSDIEEDNEAGSGSDNGLEDKVLGRSRLILEKRYANPNDGGYTYVDPNGEKLPLTPAMLQEWSREMADGKVSQFNPPNTLAFDPQMRRRSLFQRSHASAAMGLSEPAPPLTQASELLREVRKLFGGSNSSHPTSSDPPTSPIVQRQYPSSPPINTPSKLRRYLEYAEQHLGVDNATTHEHRLIQESVGPDILPLISDQTLVECGVPLGDVIRLKRGASAWWTSPEAKRPKIVDQPPVNKDRDGDFAGITYDYDIRFEKRFPEGGSLSVFGSGIRPGRNRLSRQFKWFFYNSGKKCVEPVPRGFIPMLDPEYLDVDAPYEETDEDSNDNSDKGEGATGGN